MLREIDTADSDMEDALMAFEDIDNDARAGAPEKAEPSRIFPRVPPLSVECEFDLIRQAQDGNDAARDRLVLAYVPVIQKMAAGRARRLKRVSAEDLFQEAVVGVLRAIERFTPDGTPFEHYARKWIRGSMLTSIETQMQSVRIPRPVLRLAWRYWATERRMMHERSARPSFLDVTHALGFSQSECARLRKAFFSMGAESFDAANVYGTAVPIDRPLLSRLADPNVRSPEEILAAKTFGLRVEQALKNLHFWERDVLMMRIDDGFRSALPYGHIGLALGITRREVRSVAVCGLRRLVRMQQHGSITLA